MYCAVAQLVGVDHVYHICVQYGTSLSVPNNVPSQLFHVIVYVFTVAVKTAVYSAACVTATGSGSHQLNVYVYCGVFALLASACVGTTPYSTSVVSIGDQSSFFHVIVKVMDFQCA